MFTSDQEIIKTKKCIIENQIIFYKRKLNTLDILDVQETRR